MASESSSAEPQAIENEISDLEMRLAAARARLNKSRRENLATNLTAHSPCRKCTNLQATMGINDRQTQGPNQQIISSS